MLESHGDRLKCVGCVIGGDGFRAVITRGALTGMALLMLSRKLPISFLSNVRSTVESMSRYVRIPSVDALSSTIEEIRSHIVSSSRA